MLKSYEGKTRTGLNTGEMLMDPLPRESNGAAGRPRNGIRPEEGDDAAITILGKLRELDIRLALESGKLRCSAPKGRLTPALQREIADHKDELVRYLSTRTTVQGISKADRTKDIPLTLAQESLYFLYRLQPQNGAYNMAAMCELDIGADVQVVKNSLRMLVERYEILRTAFVDKDGIPLQLIQEGFDPELQVSDLRSELDVAGELQALMREEADQPFDLGRAPLFRTRLVLRSAQTSTLILIIHHIIADATSIGVLFRELRQLCDLQRTKGAAILPAPALQYADFACWQRSSLRSADRSSDLEYWRRKLAGSTGILQLATDRPRPRQQSTGGAVFQYELQGLTQPLKELAKEERASSFMVLLAAFHALLYRLTRQGEILIGSPADQRDRAELEDLVGMCVNTLVLKAEFPERITGRELVRQVRETVMEAHEHSSVSVDKLVEIVRPDRDLSRAPLVQVLFALQNTRHRSGYWAASTSSMFDLSFYVMEFEGTLYLAIEYCSDLFDASTIARMAKEFEMLTRGMMETPDQAVSRLPILSLEDRQLLESRNQTQQRYPKDLCVHEWVERQCALTPDAVAVVSPGQTLTYRELDQRAGRLARRLHSMGVGPEVLVGVLLDRSVEMVVALLAVLKAGGAYVPLDPVYPKDRLAFMLEDSHAAVLLTQESLLASVPRSSAFVLCIEHLPGEVPATPDEPPIPAAGPDNCAYTIYTSGSTGTPKGVQVLHRSVVNFLASMQRQPGLTANDRLLAVTTLSFDIAGLELFLPLVSGARVVIAPRSATGDGAALARMLQQERITVMQATPVTWRLLLESGWQGTPGLKILCGGEALSQELANRLLHTGAEVWNLYGPTETTIWSTVHRLTAENEPISIGKPIANTQLYILDDYLQPVPPGAVGELYIGGDGLARGYLERPELTASRFLEDPFQPGGRMYRTGDLARMLPARTLEYLGRVDQQVKLRGFRIELGEIEAILDRQPGVRQSVVIVREDSPGDQRLVAYIKSSDRLAAQAGDLREALQAKLPEYMVPSSYVYLDAFPLTPNQKVDRKALPAPDVTAVAAPSARYVAPGTDTEKQVAGIWQVLLKNPTVGTNENFFDLGGHSLLVVQLQSRLKKQLGREISIVELFQHPTVGEIASLLDRKAREEAIQAAELLPSCKSLVAMRPGGSNPPLFIVPGINGSVLTCTRLSTAAGPDQPVYGFHARGLDGKEAPLDRVEDLARAYLREMRTVQARGPYHILGICIGGSVAFEMARLLEEQGEIVETLALIQSWIPESLQPAGAYSIHTLRPVLFFQKRIRQHLAIMSSLSLRQRLHYVFEKTRLVLNTLTGKVHQPLREDLLDQLVQTANYSAASRYRPKPVNCPLLLIIADERPSIHQSDPRLGWAKFTNGSVTIRRLPGLSTHALMIEPAVSEVASILVDSILTGKMVEAGATL